MTHDVTKDTKIRQRVLYGTISNYVGHFVTVGTLFFLTPFILRQLGPTTYGLWVLAGSVLGYGMLLDFGIWGAIIKYVAEFRARGEIERAHGLIATALSLYVILGLVAVILSATIAPIFPIIFKVPLDQRVVARWLVILMGLGIGISIPCMTPLAVLRGLQRYDIVNLVEIVGTLFFTLATVIVLLLGGGVLSLVAVNICRLLLLLALGIYFIHRIEPELRFGWRGANRQLVRTVISYSWPLFVKDVAGRLQTRTDEITIGIFFPVSAVTPYNLARRLSEATHLLTKQFMKVLLPLASELHAEDDRARLRSLYIAGTRLTLVISLPIGCTLVILARPILTLWVGAEYAGYAHLVAILTLASFMVTSMWPAAAVLQGMARHRVLAATSLSSGLANLALSVTLVHPFGLTGVALGTLVPTMIEYIGIVLPYAQRVIGVSGTEAVREIFVPALLPAVPMTLLLYALQQAFEPASLLTILAVAGMGVVVYIVAYLSIGASQAERQTYRNLALSTLRFAGAHLKRQ